MAGQAPGADFGAFVEETGTNALAHLDDESGDLWMRFGTERPSTFLFVNDDGTYEVTAGGAVDQERLESTVLDLIGR